MTRTKGDNTKEQIMLGAGRLFDSKGFHNTGIEDIARELKIARGTLYQYFKSKEDLLEQVLFWNEGLLLGELKRLAGIDFVDKEKIFGQIIRVFIEHKNRYGDLFGTYFSVNPEITVSYREEGLPPFTRIIGVVEELLRMKMSNFELSIKPYELGVLAFMIIQGILITTGVNNADKRENVEFIDRWAGLFLHGVLSGTTV